MNSLDRPNRQKLRNGFAFLIAAAGLGLCGYAGLLWRELPNYTDQEVRTSTEINLAIDLAKRNQQDPPADQQQTAAMRKRVEDEVRADIAKEQDWPKQWLRSGVVLLVLALLMAWPSLRVASSFKRR